MNNIQELNLPEFAFLDANVCDKNELQGRTVILHVRSASVVEIFDREDVFLKQGTISFKFSYTNSFGIREPMIAALHYCATLDVNTDGNLIKELILKPCAKWYCNYCEWEDNNIINESYE